MVLRLTKKITRNVGVFKKRRLSKNTLIEYRESSGMTKKQHNERFIICDIHFIVIRIRSVIFYSYLLYI